MKARFLWLVAGLLVAGHGSISAADSSGKGVKHPEFVSYQGNYGFYQDQSKRPIQTTEFTTCSVKRTGNELSITLPAPYGTHKVESETLQYVEHGDRNEGFYQLYFAPLKKSGSNLGHMHNYKKGKKGGTEHKGVITIKSASLVVKVNGKIETVGCHVIKK